MKRWNVVIDCYYVCIALAVWHELRYPNSSNRLHADEHKTDDDSPPLQAKHIYKKAAAPAKTKARRPPAAFTFSAPEELVSLAAEELPDVVEVAEAKPVWTADSELVDVADEAPLLEVAVPRMVVLP